MVSGAGLECFWGDLKGHPKCPHGPAVLFGKRVDDETKYFYACSACRDRKMCNFFLPKDEKLSKIQLSSMEKEAKKFAESYNHRKLYIRFNELLNQSPENRAYCHTCGQLMSTNENPKHKDHEITSNLTDEQMYNPSTLLKPLSNPKKEAQYLFSTKTTIDIVNMLRKVGMQSILCIGTPRIHEYVSQHHANDMSSLLLDFDGRYHSFFGPLSFCWYNLFNHYFFNAEAGGVFKDFLTQNHGRDMCLVTDPPFGARLEFISQTIKKISELHCKWNKLTEADAELRIFFIFPYFMESVMQVKSNPPGVDGGLKELKMSDFKVDYDNHPLFVTGSNGRKHGSPVRIFTNIPLNLLELPAEDGYKYCKRCVKWVAAENKHCKKCKSCTSKDGRRYRHCKICERCVKPTWKHCKKCQRCILEKHTCGEKPKITGQCFKCRGTDHTEKDCPDNGERSPKVAGKRKRKNSNVEPNTRQKTEESPVVKKKIKGEKVLKKSVELSKGKTKLMKKVEGIPSKTQRRIVNKKVNKKKD